MICGGNMKEYKDLNQAFVESIVDLVQTGDRVSSRGSNQIEKLFYSMMIKDPSALSINVPARKFNPSYAVTEWMWYLGRNPYVNNIGKLAKIWIDIQDDNGMCESNYGCYLLGDQWHWVVNELLNDRDSRRGTIVINQPYHKGKNEKDYPCTQYVHFFIRDNKLHLGVNMRSNDAVFGFCNDVFTFCMFQQLMLNDLNWCIGNEEHCGQTLELGHYYHNAGSFHIYERHWSMADKIAKNYYVKAQNEGYPDLNKWKLKSNIISRTSRFHIPLTDMKKEEIIEYTKTTMEKIYE